jgi:hypothetical protein
MAVDLSDPLYAAIKGNTGIAAALSVYQGQPAIFTIRPVPKDAQFPMILVAGDITYGDEDFIDAEMPAIMRDIAIYGQNPVHYRTVETLGYAVRDLFHRKRESLTVSGWSVTDIRCSGPIVAPVDDDTTVGRIVTLRIRLTR